MDISDENFDLKHLLLSNFQSTQIQSVILNRVLNFIYKFQMFREIKTFMDAVYKHIYNTLEVKDTNLNEFEYILIKTTLTGFIQDYVNYMSLYDKERVFEFLTQSFGRLSLEPLIINLGLLLKPIYQEQDDQLISINSEDTRITAKVELGETDVGILNNNDTVLIKEAVNDWLEIQILDLNAQDEIREKLKVFYNDMAEIYDIKKDSDLYRMLLIDIMEMLSLKLTVMSLMESISDSSFKPVPIN